MLEFNALKLVLWDILSMKPVATLRVALSMTCLLASSTNAECPNYTDYSKVINLLFALVQACSFSYTPRFHISRIESTR